MKTHLSMLALAVAVLVAGCSSGNKCRKACRRIEQCYGETGSAPPCTLSATCSLKEECQASCILDASCAAIMGTDVPGQQALVSCSAQCATLPEGDTGIVIPEGGAWMDMGPQPEGGAPDFYVVPSDFYVPPADGPLGPPRGKFCNDLSLGGNPFTATFKLGTPPNQWVIQAYSGECQPAVNITCPTIPAMVNPTAEVTDGTNTLIAGTFTVEIKNGEEWIFFATIDGGPLKPGYTCKTTDPTQP